MSKINICLRCLVLISFLSAAVFVTQGCAQQPKSYSTNNNTIEIKTNNSNLTEYNIGDKMDFNISVTTPLYLNCFYESKDGIQKFTPGYLYTGAKIEKQVTPKYPLNIEGGYAGYPVGEDKLSCIGTEVSVTEKLPRELSAVKMFDKVYYRSMDDIYKVFKDVVDGKLYYQSVIFKIDPAESA